MKHRYQDVTKNEVKLRGKIPAEIEYENNKQKLQISITERNDITPLLGMDWMKKFKLTIKNIRIQDSNQSKKKRVIEKLPAFLKNNTTIKDTEINIQLKPGHYSVKKSKSHPTTLTRSCRERSGEINKSRTLGERKTRRRRLFCFTGDNYGKERQVG